MVHYQLKGKVSAGARILIQSAAKQSDLDVTLTHRHYTMVMPVVPVEVTLQSKAFLFSIGYEYALVHWLKGGDLQDYERGRYALLVFEGLRIK